MWAYAPSTAMGQPPFIINRTVKIKGKHTHCAAGAHDSGARRLPRQQNTGSQEGEDFFTLSTTGGKGGNAGKKADIMQDAFGHIVICRAAAAGTHLTTRLKSDSQDSASVQSKIIQLQCQFCSLYPALLWSSSSLLSWFLNPTGL